jgi:hypothetical protein
MKKDWVRFELNEHSFFVQRSHIIGVGINKNKPTQLTILMTNDSEEGTVFNFNSVQERNEKLNEIFEGEEETNVIDSECGSPSNKA